MATLSYSNTFSNVQPTDFILRTNQSSQNLAIGNGGGSNVNAGLYLKQNSVGFRAPPKPSLVFDCINALEVSEQSNVMIPTRLYCAHGEFSNLQSTNAMFSNTKTDFIVGLSNTLNIANDSNTTLINIATAPISSKQIVIGNGQATSVTIGQKPTDTVNLSGQSINIQSDVFNVQPKTIRINASGLSNTSDVCGIEFVENDTAIGHLKTSSNRGGFSLKPPMGQEFLVDTTNNQVSFQSNKLTISNNGNIGIATTTPDTLLTVNGDAKVTNNLQSTTANINILNAPTFTSSNATVSNLNTASTTACNANVAFCQANTIEFQQPINANGRLVLFKRVANDHEISSIGYSNNLLKIQLDATNKAITFNTATSASSSTEIMRMSGNGNVGIGTTNPQQKLDVNGDVTVSNILYASQLQPSRTSNLTIEPANMTSWVTLNKTNKSGGISMFDKHVFTETGVSLGNSTFSLPTHTLQVSGYSILQNATLSNDTAFFYLNPLSGDNASKTLLGEHIYYDSQDDKYVVLSDGANASFGALVASKGAVSFYTGSFQGQTANFDIAGSNFKYLEKMYIGENVGIGTNLPQAKLHISGDGMDNKIKVSTQSNFEASFTFEDETGYGWSLSRPGNKQHLKISNSQRDVAYMMPNGNVGIGSTFENVSTEALLHVQDTQSTSNVFHAGNPLGSVRFTANGKLCAYTFNGQKYFEAPNNQLSDKRLKTNIVPVENALEKTESLNGVYFNFLPQTGLGTEKQIGCIAQDVGDVIPEVIEVDKESGYYRMHYEKLVPLLIESIKELSQKVKSQEADISQLKAVIHSIQTTPT